jgi:transposase InsO family protein
MTDTSIDISVKNGTTSAEVCASSDEAVKEHIASTADAIKGIVPGAHLVIDGKNLRILDIDHGETVTLVEMNTRSLRFFTNSYSHLLDEVEDGSVLIIRDSPPVFDLGLTTEAERSDFNRKKTVVLRVSEEYGPDYYNFCGAQAKHFCTQLAVEYGMTAYTVREMVRDWLQSGMQDHALLRRNSRAFRLEERRTLYNYTKKPGRRTKSGVPTGIIIDSHIIACFEAGYRYYKSSKAISLREAYDEMNCRFFRDPDYKGYSPGDDVVLLPMTERPTFRQFCHYITKIRNRIDEDISRYGELEIANNRRPLVSDEQYRVYGSGDLALVDALEVDIAIISSDGTSQSIGRPILYTMIDAYSKLVLSVSVGFDNNSYIGLTSLFANLVRPARIFQQGFDDIQLLSQGWVTGILPDQIRTDRGSDFMSKGFEKFCCRTRLYQEINRGGYGSGKGSIEAFHHSLHAHQQAVIRDAGLITQDHDSNHHKKAKMTLKEYASLIAREVERHNKSVMMDYDEGHNRELIEHGIRAVPLDLWEYGKQYGSPRTITNEGQFFFDLLLEEKASVTREGIVFRKLRYFSPQSARLIQDMYDRRAVPYTIRYDPRCVNSIFYLEGGEICRADLNERKKGSFSFRNLTWEEYDYYMKKQNAMDQGSREINENQRAKKRMADKKTVKDAADRGSSSDKGIRQHRKAEQRKHQKDNTIIDKIVVSETPETAEVPVVSENTEERPVFIMPPDTDYPPGMFT